MHDLPGWLFNILSPVNRWVHIVASTLLVGGVLFFEFIVPLATADLTDSQQLAVFGRARWVFRRVVWLSVVALVLTGCVSIWRMWPTYVEDEKLVGSFALASRPWVAGHVVLAALGFLIAFRVTATRKLLDHPIRWLQLLLAILLVCMFAASVARHVRLRAIEWRRFDNAHHRAQDEGA